MTNGASIIAMAPTDFSRGTVSYFASSCSTMIDFINGASAQVMV